MNTHLVSCYCLNRTGPNREFILNALRLNTDLSYSFGRYARITDAKKIIKESKTEELAEIRAAANLIHQAMLDDNVKSSQLLVPSRSPRDSNLIATTKHMLNAMLIKNENTNPWTRPYRHAWNIICGANNIYRRMQDKQRDKAE